MRVISVMVIAATACVAMSLRLTAGQAPADGPRYVNGTSLVRPPDYREWVFLSSGLGMTYTPPSDSRPASTRPPDFGNVFVNAASYRGFLQTGVWPNGTVFVLENRRSATEGSINQGGRFQTELASLEAEVKDTRFPDGWAFYDFGRAGALKDQAEPLSGNAVRSCVECHTKNTAVERTFVQFYPTLLEVARQKGTLKPGF